ncbi:MAG: orotidine-5'-phosphate decarboxylase [Dehalococcoidia bacterium]
MSFSAKLAAAVRRNRSLLCVGLDPAPDRMPIADPVAFCREIIAATRDLVCCYKPNAAFFEQFGRQAFAMLDEVRQAIPDDVPALLDAKRGDIGNTADAYAHAAFDVLGYDALTVSPYLGGDSLEPFLARPDKTAFVLCRTSNPGAGDFQDLPVSLADGRVIPLYQAVAERCREWNTAGNIGLVVGATYPEQLGLIRSICPEQPILVPGIGAQGGDVRTSVDVGRGDDPTKLLLSASRQVLYAGSGPNFADAARRAAEVLQRETAAGLLS